MAWRAEGDGETGRIWWGGHEGDWVGPLRGVRADQFATSIGLSIPGPNETGTSIAILAPRWTSDGEEEAQQNVAADRQASLGVVKRAILWNCWPRMVSTPTISFHVRWFGEVINLEDPRQDPHLSHFARALDLVRGASPDAPLESVSDAQHGTKKLVLGRTGLTLSPFIPTRGGPMTARPRVIGDSLRHVALMRANLLVVKYLPVAAGLSPKLQLAGVFLAHPKQDRVFAASEPPTHDDWRPGRIPRDQATIVRVALTRIREFADSLAFPAQAATVVAGQPLADMGNALGALVLGSEGGGPTSIDEAPPTKRPPRSSAPGRRKRAGIDVLAPIYGRTHADWQELTVPFAVTPAGETTDLRARLTVVVDGNDGDGAEETPALMAATPSILEWTVEGEPATPDARGVVTLRGRLPREVRLRVKQPLDCVVDIGLTEAGTAP
jgi:hypothetical protein